MNGRWSRILRFVFFVICVVLLVFQGKELGDDLVDNYQSDREYEQWTDDTKEKDGDICFVDFESLQKKNPDIVAWIHIPDTTINYPVVQGCDNDYYLRHTAAKEESHTGAIFLDAGCEPDFSSDNSVIYGHNLRHERMFGVLKRLYDPSYNEEASFKKHPDIYIDLPQKRMIYHIFSVRKIHADTQRDVYTLDFSDEQVWQDYMREAADHSMIRMDDLPAEQTSILTLTTCSSDGADGRLIVQAYAKEEEKGDNVE